MFGNLFGNSDPDQESDSLSRVSREELRSQVSESIIDRINDMDTYQVLDPDVFFDLIRENREEE
jgi:hypothetical protein